MLRPVHFASHGSRGLVFDCYRAEYERYHASPDTLPTPLARSDLRKVTCPECWAAMLKMATDVTSAIALAKEAQALATFVRSVVKPTRKR